MSKGRQTNLMGSTYVSGNIDHKSRRRWVDAIPELSTFDPSKMEDEELGLTLKACGRMKTNSCNALHKVNQKGSRQGWTAHNSGEKREIEAQQEKVLEFYEVLNAEFNKRMAEERTPANASDDVPPKQTIQIDVSQNIAPDEMEELVEIMEESGHKVVTDCELYELVKDVPLQEILLFAQKGLNGGDDTKLREELTAAVADNVRHVEEKQKLEKQLQSKTDELLRLQAKFNTLEKEHGDLKRENKKAKQKLDQFKQLSARL